MARRSKKSSEQALVQALLDRYGRTYAREIGAHVEKNTPSSLFRLLVYALLASARIRSDIAADAARALSKKGWTTPRKMADATWAQRAKTLDRAGYARYDERTSRMLEDTARRLLADYGGDLRRLRDEAGRDPARERKLLQRFKGIGKAGVDIFLREVQGSWDEVSPFADRKAKQAANELGLPSDPDRLRRLVKRADFPRLVAALVRCALDKGYDEVRQAA